MRYKTLKHNTLEDTYGVIYQDEIWHSLIPKLYPLTATVKALSDHWQILGEKKLLEQLEEYNFVEVEVNLVEYEGEETSRSSGELSGR